MTSKSERPKVRIINVPSRVRIANQETSSEDLIRQAAEFCQKCREHIGVDNQHGFDFDELRRCADKFRTVPTALILVRSENGGPATWTLLLEDHYSRDGKIDLYSPVRGVISPELSSKIHQLFYFPGDGTGISNWQTFKAANPNYKLNPDYLRQLGPIQTTPADCGPLCLFARSITSTN